MKLMPCMYLDLSKVFDIKYYFTNSAHGQKVSLNPYEHGFIHTSQDSINVSVLIIGCQKHYQYYQARVPQGSILGPLICFLLSTSMISPTMLIFQTFSSLQMIPSALSTSLIPQMLTFFNKTYRIII